MKQQILSVISKHIDVPIEELQDDVYLTETLDLNSFDLVVLSCEIEDCFGIEIDVEDRGRLRTVGNLTAYIEERIFDKRRRQGSTAEI